MPKETDSFGMGKLIGYVLCSILLNTASNISAFRIAKKVVGERFGPEKKVKRDMLGSFLAHGLTQREARTETLLQMYVGHSPLISLT
jgi:hypothetical protein